MAAGASGTSRRRPASSYIGHSSGAVFFDYDRDGLLDLFLVNVGVYTTDEHAADGRLLRRRSTTRSRGHLKPERTEPSILFHNLGGNHFSRRVARDGPRRRRGWSGDASPVDVNEDGWPDLYVLNMQGDDQYYQNDGGKRFVRKSREVFPAHALGRDGHRGLRLRQRRPAWTSCITDMHSDMSERDRTGAARR